MIAQANQCAISRRSSRATCVSNCLPVVHASLCPFLARTAAGDGLRPPSRLPPCCRTSTVGEPAQGPAMSRQSGADKGARHSKSHE
eukprot:3969217-Pleurochrysis_carterae.AAC.1